MIVDILMIARNCLEFKGTNGKSYRLETAMEDMKAYSQLNDEIIELIRYSNEPALIEAKKILERIETRDFYPIIGSFIIFFSFSM